MCEREREGERVRKNVRERERKGERFETTFDLFMLFLKHSKFQLRPNVRVQTKKFTQRKPYEELFFLVLPSTTISSHFKKKGCSLLLP